MQKAVVFELTCRQDFFSVTSTPEDREHRDCLWIFFILFFFVKTQAESIVLHTEERGGGQTQTHTQHGRHKERGASREGKKADRTER